MLGDFFVGFGGLACSAWRLVALCRWPPHPKTALLEWVEGRPILLNDGRTLKVHIVHMWMQGDGPMESTKIGCRALPIVVYPEGKTW